LSKKLALLLTLIPFVVFANKNDYIPYTFQKGDTVTDVMIRHNLKPLYGKEGWMQKILKLNRITLESATKMEAGDMILVPRVETPNKKIKAIAGVENLTDGVLDYVSPKGVKHYNFSILTGYFNQDLSFASAAPVSVNQNLMLMAKYKERLPSSNYFISYNPNIEVEYFTQANPVFENDPGRSIDFSDSYSLNLGYEIEYRPLTLGFNTALKFERFSTLTQGGDNYRVRDLELTWIGTQITKNIYDKKWSAYIGFEGFLGSEFNASELALKLGGNFYHMYRVELGFRQIRLEIDELVTNNQVSTSIGYLF
jgi:hypothetical protein